MSVFNPSQNGSGTAPPVPKHARSTCLHKPPWPPCDFLQRRTSEGRRTHVRRQRDMFKPVVASRTSSIRTAIFENKCGFLCALVSETAPLQGPRVTHVSMHIFFQSTRTLNDFSNEFLHVSHPLLELQLARNRICRTAASSRSWHQSPSVYLPSQPAGMRRDDQFARF